MPIRQQGGKWVISAWQLGGNMLSTTVLIRHLAGSLWMSLAFLLLKDVSWGEPVLHNEKKEATGGEVMILEVPPCYFTFSPCVCFKACSHPVRLMSFGGHSASCQFCLQGSINFKENNRIPMVSAELWTKSLLHPTTPIYFMFWFCSIVMIVHGYLCIYIFTYRWLLLCMHMYLHMWACL